MFSVAIPYQFYNLVLTFVTILLLLWGMMAVKRVYWMLRVRSAVLSDRVIQIRGLGSYLTYFDGATRSHLDAVVHTRQSMPPVAMEAIAVTATVTGMTLSKAASTEQFQINLNIVAERKTKVICLVDFQSTNFQQLVYQYEVDRSQSAARSFTALTGCRDNALLSTATMFPNFQRVECCRFECLCSEVDIGEHNISLPLLFTMNDWLNDRLRAHATRKGESGETVEDKVTIAVMLVPMDERRRSHGRLGGRGKGNASAGRGGEHSAELGECGAVPRPPNGSSGTADGTSCDENGDAGVEDDLDVDLSDAPEDTPLRGTSPLEIRSPSASASAATPSSGRNPMTAAIPSATPSPVPPAAARSHSMFAAVFAHSLPLSALGGTASAVGADAAPSPAAAQVGASVTEVLVLDRRCRLFASQEIFGLGVSHPAGESATSPGASTAVPTAQAAGPPTSPTRRAAQAVSAGGRLVAEDCVVCLSAPKSVLLLPCRHLCVCDACLVFLDKCPVCRAGFEEYISISNESAAPAPDAGGNGSTAGGDGTSSGTVLRI